MEDTFSFYLPQLPLTMNVSDPGVSGSAAAAAGSSNGLDRTARAVVAEDHNGRDMPALFGVFDGHMGAQVREQERERGRGGGGRGGKIGRDQNPTRREFN